MAPHLFRLLLLMALWLGLTPLAQARQLVSSVYPLHLISQAVTAGLETPSLLIPAGEDGHHLQLSPSQARALRQADLVLWVGPALEAPLQGVLQGQPNQLMLSRLPGLRRLPLRGLDGQPIPSSLDPHLWLDPVNAIAMAHAVAAVRAVQFPADAARYRANADRFTAQLLDAVRRNRPAMLRPYWAWHDAYQYLETSQQLQFLGALTPDPELPPRLSRLQQAARTAQPHCLLAPVTLPDGLQHRLRTLQPVLIQESLPTAHSFVDGWTRLVQQLKSCR